ncbi:endonuclease/exonuclease/phosphatase family protein [Variovorax sp. HJSM1_2]|uniref:endonuclease/exonuclease/phosphatase family protein n=1 Tax=Variovorax sp. HJSM1_2 TaxID=3366263 RepID=UPI003BD757CE
MQLSVLTYNTLFGGRDGTASTRATAQMQIILGVRPDVLLLQEATGFDGHGGAWLHELEAAIGMRGFLAPAARTGFHVAVFLRAPLRPIAFHPDPANFHHALATLRVAVPGLKQPMDFSSVHLCPFGPEVRRREASYLSAMAAPQALSLLAGDFNSCSPHDPEPADWPTLPAHYQSRHLVDGCEGVDRSVMARLERAGWVDLGNQFGANGKATVPTPAYRNAEFATMRCDYLLASKALAPFAVAYEVIQNTATENASDHYPVLARFALPATA